MVARTPEDCDRLFAECVKNRDLDGLVSLYLPNAKYVERDRSVHAGHGTALVVDGMNQPVEMCALRS